MKATGSQQRMGRYSILEPVGRGAMGIVYRAEDPLIHRDVAVKVLRQTTGLTAQQIGVARGRFMREAQTAGGIDHPGIVRIFDVGEEAGTGEMYIVMEYISGPSLEAMLAEGPLDLDRVTHVIGEVASALDAAHARGIIHRDIKPSNILFTETGIPKIVDFGITHVAASHLTQDMAALGTPAYTSPEQLQGKPLDAKADLFSLGVMCYEMLTGTRPFQGVDAASIGYQVTHAEPDPVHVVNPALPPSLSAVVGRMLAKDPAERFGSGAELHAMLVASATGASAGSTAAKRWVAGKWLAATGVAMAACLLLFAVAQRGSSSPEASAIPNDASQEPNGGLPATAGPSGTGKAPSGKADARKVPGNALGRPSAPSLEMSSALVPSKEIPRARVQVSLTHRVAEGRIEVFLDAAPILRESFSKTKLAIVQTTTWDPFSIPSGSHEITARVVAADGREYRSDPYPVSFERGEGADLRIAIKGDGLTIRRKELR